MGRRGQLQLQGWTGGMGGGMGSRCGGQGGDGLVCVGGVMGIGEAVVHRGSGSEVGWVKVRQRARRVSRHKSAAAPGERRAVRLVSGVRPWA
ncbi:hypothetical protein, partial [Xylella fastidiosa]|uniref:hypothetical protein n=1 Tax=Xylella fastidiosa TaxID=2371 RepID=UPI003D001A5E